MAFRVLWDSAYSTAAACRLQALDAPLRALNASAFGQQPGAATEALQASHGGSPWWLWPIAGATCCWAVSDVICDSCIGHAKAAKDPPEEARDGAPPPRRPGGRSADLDQQQLLTPEQNALINGCVSLVSAAAAAYGLATSGAEILVEFDARGGMAFLGGCFHFAAYLAILCAFSSTSSTVITPLMQLSSVWMLPLSSMAALLGLAPLIRPVHLLSVLLIGAGGFLPAARGSLSHLATRAFWQQRSVKLVSLGELLNGVYNMILHQATFASAEDAPGDGPATARTLRFFVVRTLGNGLMCLAMFCLVPRLRAQAKAIPSAGARFLSAAVVGELISLCGICLATFSYSSFYEPSVVNAVEGGLQQFFNLLFAITTHQLLGYGRGVDQVGVKFVSFLLVAMGLTLSTV